jgi:hypothetical protein
MSNLRPTARAGVATAVSLGLALVTTAQTPRARDLTQFSLQVRSFINSGRSLFGKMTWRF